MQVHQRLTITSLSGGHLLATGLVPDRSFEVNEDRSGPVLTGPLQVAAHVRTGLGPQDWTDGIGPGPVLVGFGPGPDCGP